MPESAEHQFLKSAFIEVVRRFSSLGLYGFVETQRKVFDFSCRLTRSWDQPLVGQVLWNHGRGLEKDLRTLLHDVESPIKAYVLRDSVRSRQALDEVLRSYKANDSDGRLTQLRVFWVPSDFDADDPKQREHARSRLQAEIVHDILFNVVFGRLRPEHVEMFLQIPGIQGLSLGILYHISTQGFISIRKLTQQFDTSASPIRETLLVLHGAGMIQRQPESLHYFTTERGRVFLDLLARLVRELREETNLTRDLLFLLHELRVGPPAGWPNVIKMSPVLLDPLYPRLVSPTLPFFRLQDEVAAAITFGFRPIKIQHLISSEGPARSRTRKPPRQPW